MQRGWHDIALKGVRWVLGALFLFSGAVKAVDPVGTSIYIDKYLAAYSLDALLPASEALGVVLSTVEFALGVLLVVGTLSRYVALVATLLLALFTMLTLLSATLLPIGDCGCFGDALSLTPWQTLLKNILLLPMALWLWRSSKPSSEGIMLRDIVTVAIATALPIGISLYALCHLPLVDYMPYAVGRNLRDDVAAERDAMVQGSRQVLLFRDRSTGRSVERDATDVACWADANLEYLDARVEYPDMDTTYDDFMLYAADGAECSLELLRRTGRVALICLNGADAMSPKEQAGIDLVLAHYPAEAIVVLAARSVDYAPLQGLTTYAIDAMTLRSVLRSDYGVVVLHDGVVEYKANARDIE